MTLQYSLKGCDSLKGKSISIPFGMLFKKYDCSKCGTRLKKEKTHRIVTPDDKDYYRYHDYGTFPRRDYDVYEYQFQCPACGARISYDEQCKIARIQKQQGTTVLSSAQIKDNYEQISKSNNRHALTRAILFPIVFNLLFFALFYLFATDKTPSDFGKAAILFAVLTGYFVWRAVRKFKGAGKLKVHRSYSYETEVKLQKLHAHASHNRQLVEGSDTCYCFHCKSVLESREISTYSEDGQTALCPKCNTASVIPDSIDETIDEAVIADMHDYWF